MNLFWELLSIISECDASKLFDVETESVDTEVKMSSDRNFCCWHQINVFYFREK